MGRKLSVSKREGEGGPSKCCWSTKTARSAKPGIPCQRQSFSYETSDLQYVSPHLEFATTAWAPLIEGDKKCLKKEERRAGTMLGEPFSKG
jgi:hypothetical protein